MKGDTLRLLSAGIVFLVNSIPVISIGSCGLTGTFGFSARLTGGGTGDLGRAKLVLVVAVVECSMKLLGNVSERCTAGLGARVEVLLEC